jgi:hypothetical protein
MNLNIEVNAYNDGLPPMFFWALGLGGNGILVCGRLCSDGAEGGRLWQLK